MATIDRFRDALKSGKLPEDQGGQALTAQTKYDFLAAVHSMEQLEDLIAVRALRAKKREALRKKFVETSRATLQGFLEKEDGLSDVKAIDATIKVLMACRDEFLKLAGEEQEDRILGKAVQDGVTAK